MGPTEDGARDHLVLAIVALVIAAELSAESMGVRYPRIAGAVVVVVSILVIVTGPVVARRPCLSSDEWTLMSGCWVAVFAGG